MMLAWSPLFCRACVPHDTISTLICWGCGGGGKGGGDKGGWLLLASTFSRGTSETLGLLAGGAAAGTAEEAAAAASGRALAGRCLEVISLGCFGIALAGMPELVGLALVGCWGRIAATAAPP